MGLPANKSLQELSKVASDEVVRLEQLSEKSSRSDGKLSLATDKAWDDLLKLTGLSSTSKQRTLYFEQTGLTWESVFWRVREIRFASAFSLEGYDLVRFLWRELPESRFKRFQEVFSDPTSYSVPRASLEHPIPRYPSRKTLDECSLRGVLVSPDRIPSKLAQDLGLIRWPDRNLKPIEALEEKGKRNVVQGLKSIWETSKPIEPRNSRILIIGAAGIQDRERYPAARPMPEEIVGSLLFIREEPQAKSDTPRQTRNTWTPPRKVASLFPTVYSALRKTLHERAFYETETSSLGGLVVDWEIMNSRIRSEWRRGAPETTKRELKGDILRLTERSIDLLSRVRDQDKVQCNDLLTRVAGRIGEGSNNISAILAQTLAAVRRLDRRLSSTGPKDAANNIDASSLRLIISDANRRFQAVNASLLRIGPILEREISAPHGFFNVSFGDKGVQAAYAHQLISQLRFPRSQVEGISARPFNTFARGILSAYVDLSDAIYRQSGEDTQRAFAKMVAILRLYHAHNYFEGLKNYTNLSESIPPEVGARTAQALRSINQTRSPFPLSIVPDHARAHSKVLRASSRIATILERYHSHGREFDIASLAYEKMTRHLERLDIEGLIRGLS